jgi:hypothetical protein
LRVNPRRLVKVVHRTPISLPLLVMAGRSVIEVKVVNIDKAG